uniref:Serine/threonine-protein phosphatase n=1 Tax=Parastrongyloides trichosuri TaxID=131310 RepID=A0A0N4ZGB8_PARTI
MKNAVRLPQTKREGNRNVRTIQQEIQKENKRPDRKTNVTREAAPKKKAPSKDRDISKDEPRTAGEPSMMQTASNYASEIKNPNIYPTTNVSQTQLRRIMDFLRKCDNCQNIRGTSEYYMKILLQYISLIHEYYNQDTGAPFEATRLMTLPIFSNICHKVAEILSNEPTLLMINSETPNETFLVLSDLHGSFDVLMYNFFYHHCLPKKKIIILGDYVDKGSDDAFMCLLLFLFKIVWPDKIFLLKGNHEIRDMNRQKDFPDNVGNLLGDKTCFYLFNFVFERMPLAAIWNNSVYLAHGGISQWITCREDISSIKRPLKLNRSFRSRLIITDILWSDPYRKSYKKDTFNKYFTPSKRGCGFAYSREGLDGILKCLNVTMVVRGHQTSREGFVEEYKNMCYTIHSKPSSRSNCLASSCILTLDNSGEICLKPLKYKLNMTRERMLTSLSKLKTLFKSHKPSSYRFARSCPYCTDKINTANELACQERILITHAQLIIWLSNCKVQAIMDIESGGPRKREKKTKNLDKLLCKFPLYFDFCVWTKIGYSIRDESIIERKEKDLIYNLFKKINNSSTGDKSILISNPNMTVDELTFLCLNPLDTKKKKRGNFTSDEDEGSGSEEGGGTSDEKDVSEEEED